MTNYLDQFNTQAQGSITFLYHDSKQAPMPQDYSDPLVLLGDIRMLHLSDEQKHELRVILQNELQNKPAKDIWTNRAFRKNVIHSFGSLV